MLGALATAAGLADAAAQQLAAKVVKAAEQLATLGGARDLLIVGLPDLGETPRHRGMPQATAASQLSNITLAAAIAATSGLANVAVHRRDVFALLRDAIGHPAQYGFTNLADACVTGGYVMPGTPCAPDAAGQNTHLFWDDVHPTKTALGPKEALRRSAPDQDGSGTTCTRPRRRMPSSLPRPWPRSRGLRPSPSSRSAWLRSGRLPAGAWRVVWVCEAEAFGI